jgi:hypothetical protein
MISAGRKKAYIVILVLGLGAVVIDRLIGYGTTSPATATSRPLEVRPSVVPTSRPAGLGSNLENMYFPNAVVMEAPLKKGRDPFAAPPAVFAVVRTKGRGEEGLAAPVAVAATYPERHRLSAVLTLGGAKFAVLDGTLVGVGQVYDECELREITAEAARLRCLDGEVELRLQGPISGSAAPRRAGQGPGAP